MPLDLPADLQQIAHDQLGETPEIRGKLLQELRERLQQLPVEQQPHRVDDAYLVAFLRGTKFKLDVAEKKLLAMAKFRREHPEYCEDLRAEEFKEFYNQGFMRILNGRDREGRVISCLLPSKLGEVEDPKVFMRWTVWCLEQMLADPYMQVNGQVIIENFQDFSLINMIRLQKIPRATMNKCFKLQQECAPFRMRGIFVLNQPAYMSFLWAIVRPFMKRKLRERVHFIGRNAAAFHEFIDPAVLPPEFGGTLQEAHTAWLDERMQQEVQQEEVQQEAQQQEAQRQEMQQQEVQQQEAQQQGQQEER